MAAIRHIEVLLTHRCNLRCVYCYSRAPARELPPDLSPEHAEAAVELLARSCGQAPMLRVDLWGGEPLLRPDLIELVAARATEVAARLSRELQICMPTNLTLLDEGKLAVVQRWGIELSLSLDGGPEAFAARCTASGKSSWPLIEPRLELLLARWKGGLPPVRMTILPDRASKLGQNLRWLLGRGFRQISFLPASGVVWDEQSTALLDRELAGAADLLIDWILEGRPHPPVFPPLLRRLSTLWVAEESGQPPLRAGFCGAGETLVAVGSSGDLYPCHRIAAQAHPPEDLRLGSLDSGITNHALARRLAEISADRIRCGSCPERALCGYFCIALNYQICGDLASVPDEACWLNRRLALAARRIHRAMVRHPGYRAYIEAFMHADPDERMLPLIAALQSRPDALQDRAEELLRSLGVEVEER